MRLWYEDGRVDESFSSSRYFLALHFFGDFTSFFPGVLKCPVHTYTLDKWLTWGGNKRGLKPGQATLDAIGGAHKFQSWPHNILTGSI